MLRPDFTVADLGELSTLHVAAIEEGANAWVESTKDYWILQKNSGAPVGPGIIAPLGGSPSAGAANARWIEQVISSGGVSSGLPVFRPGIPSADNAFATWPEVVASQVNVFGPIKVAVDSQHAPGLNAIIPAGTWLFNGPLTLVGANNFPNGTPDELTFQDAVLPQLVRITDLTTHVKNTVAPVVTSGPASTFFYLDGLTIADTIGATQPLVLQTGGGFMNPEVIGLASTLRGGTVGVFKSEAGGFLQTLAGGDGGFIDANTLEKGAGGSLAGIIANASSFIDPTQIGGPFVTAIWAESIFIQYNPTNPGNWSPPPANPSDALDQLAARQVTQVNTARTFAFSNPGNTFQPVVNVAQTSQHGHEYIEVTFTGNAPTIGALISFQVIDTISLAVVLAIGPIPGETPSAQGFAFATAASLPIGPHNYELQAFASAGTLTGFFASITVSDGVAPF